MSGAELIAAERQRQIDVEGWTEEHDQHHADGQLLEAAICYANEAYMPHGVPLPPEWPWDSKWWKPSEDDVRNLVKAGALIAAEIDRLQGIRP